MEPSKERSAPLEQKPAETAPKKIEAEKPSNPSAPKRVKYEMCKNWREKGSCKYGDKCLFAHGNDELSSR